jgi:hypothetical protein
MLWHLWSEEGIAANSGGIGKEPGEEVLWSHRLPPPGYGGVLLTTLRLVQTVGGVVVRILNLDQPFEVRDVVELSHSAGGTRHVMTYTMWTKMECREDGQGGIAGDVPKAPSDSPLTAHILTFDCASSEAAAFLVRAVEHQSRILMYQRYLENLDKCGAQTQWAPLLQSMLLLPLINGPLAANRIRQQLQNMLHKLGKGYVQGGDRVRRVGRGVEEGRGKGRKRGNRKRKREKERERERERESERERGKMRGLGREREGGRARVKEREREREGERDVRDTREMLSDTKEREKMMMMMARQTGSSSRRS